MSYLPESHFLMTQVTSDRRRPIQIVSWRGQGQREAQGPMVPFPGSNLEAAAQKSLDSGALAVQFLHLESQNEVLCQKNKIPKPKLERPILVP